MCVCVWSAICVFVMLGTKDMDVGIRLELYGYRMWMIIRGHALRMCTKICDRHSAQNVHSSDYRYRGQLRRIAGKHT